MGEAVGAASSAEVLGCASMGDAERAALQAAAFLRGHVTETVTLADVADAVGYSPFHLARAFTATVRISPIRYLAAHRFHLAKRLLLTERLSVVDTCHEVGFSSPGTFIRRFREQVGVAPGDLQRLADEVTSSTAPPFRVGSGGAGTISIRVHLPPATEVGREPLVWVGLYPHPVPVGVPGAGAMRRGEGDMTLPVTPGHPWLLATVVPDVTDPLTHLADDAPHVGMHPAPLTTACEVEVGFRPARGWETPILTALPALRKIGVS
ncbi:MAG: helix-turn-helix transcriptional regulator [Mobilicoccus sp.]|nr:helix-turn-helix transcriptional regulator [Mobilicoccus sp.]